MVGMESLKQLVGLSVVVLLAAGLMALTGIGLFNAGKIAEREKTSAVTALDSSDQTAGFEETVAASRDDSAFSFTPWSSTAAKTKNNASDVARNSMDNPVAPQMTMTSSFASIQAADDPSKQVTLSSQSYQDSSEYRRHKDVYFSLQDTCNRWTRWYNKSHSSSDGIQMNISCRDAADYARQHLNKNYSANHVELSSGSTSSGRAAILIGSGSSSGDSYQCRSYKDAKDAHLARMRAGFKASSDNSLRRRLRYLSDKVHEYCN